MVDCELCREREVSLLRYRGVIPGGAGGATAPQLLANNTFFRFHTPLTIISGVNGFFYVSHSYIVMSDIVQLKIVEL